MAARRGLHSPGKLIAARMTTNFRLLGITHFAILAAVPLLAVALAVVQCRLLPGKRHLRFALGILLLADSAWWYAYLISLGQPLFPGQLPLELCDITLLLVALELLTLNLLLFDLAYYWALAGTSMALLTPNLWEHFPSLATVQFFAAHGLVVAATLYLVWSRLARPRPGSVWRALLAVNIFAAIVGTFDAIFKTDYMYLRTKPENMSLLTYLGPWPWYIASGEVVAFVLFLLLYLPFWRRQHN